MKKFEKISTIVALEAAKERLATAVMTVEVAKATLDMDNTRANRKALRRAEIELEHALARVDHIEVALAYQSENHNAILRKPQIGEVLVIPTKEEKEVEKMIPKKIVNPKNEHTPTEKSKEWEQKKAEIAEAKRLKREAKKAAAEEIRKARAVEAAARAEAEKAQEAIRKAEKMELEKKEAFNVLPVEAAKMVRALDNYDLLISSMDEEIKEISDERDILWYKARDLKNEIKQLSQNLKKPMCSSTVRRLMLDKQSIDMKISAMTSRKRALTEKRNSCVAERRALVKEVRLLRKYGNPAVRPTVRAIQREIERRSKIEKIDEAVRTLETITERCKKDSFQIWSWDKDTVLESTGLKDLFAAANSYKSSMKNSEESEKAFENSRKAIKALEKMVEDGEPIRLSVSKARATRLQQNLLSFCMKIDTEAETVRPEWISVEHGIYTSLSPSWKLFDSKKAVGQEMARKFVERVFQILDNIVIRWWDNTYTTYRGLYSSASHQKHEKIVSCKEDLMKVHERLVWFGKTKAEVLASDITGAEIWKMRANMARPIAFALKTKDGNPVYLHNISMVPDKKKLYHHERALLIGNDHNGKPYEYTSTDNEVICGDGAILAVKELDHSAEQGGGAGMKGMIVQAIDALKYAENKHGRKANIPDNIYLVCGDGCFKFNKLYESYTEYTKVMDEMSEQYPGINQVYALRESEEVVDEEKVRKMSRSLLQMLPIASSTETKALARNVIDSLLYKKTFEGLFTSLAELGVPQDKRSPFADVIFECPMLLTNLIVQGVGKNAWYGKKHDAMGNKIRTKGQYPYIMQDPVALIEIWLLDIDPNDPDLGVLKSGEASVVGVPEGKEMVVIRYPANFFTAKTVVSKPMKDIFGSCGNVAILSVHDDVLIIQDGDVDGDEAGFFYDELLVKLVKDMRRKIQPPVVVFEHGDKATRLKLADEAEMLTKKAKDEATSRGSSEWKTYTAEDVLKKRMYSSLHSAKEFDSVGKYANLARDCAYLTCVELHKGSRAHKSGDMKQASVHSKNYSKYVLWMAAASTGAILAIDQVKGNAIDEKLIKWLDSIEADVAKQMVKKVEKVIDNEKKMVDVHAAPFTQPYVKNDMSIDTLPLNPDVNTDELAGYIDETAGEWSHDGQGFFRNDDALASLILDNRHKLTAVRSNPLTMGVLANLRSNYFNRPVTKNGKVVNGDSQILNCIRNGLPVSQIDVLLMYFRNMSTLEFKMQAKTVAGKKLEYYKDVHDALITQAISYEWVQEKSANYEAGHVFTDEEKFAAVVNNALIYALELYGRKNSVDLDLKPAFAKFVMSVFAKELLDNIHRNGVNIKEFLDETEATKVIEEAGYDEVEYTGLLETLYEVVDDASVLNDGSVDLGSDYGYDYIPSDLIPA